MFIVSTYVLNAGDKKNTSKKGFFSDPRNFAVDESISLVRNIRDNDLKRANLILNLKKKTVVKCREYHKDGVLVEDTSYEDLLEYFKGIYPEQIELALKMSE
jgi:hypothetical protein